MSKGPRTYDGLTFDAFKKLARSDTLSSAEKIGFTCNNRAGYEGAIFKDLVTKVPRLQEKNISVLDIGCGCGDLVNIFISHCEKMSSRLVLVDSDEMLSQVPSSLSIKKVPGRFPEDSDVFNQQFDVIVAYSVLHYVLGQSCVFSFLDSIIQLMKPGGQAIIGDIPSYDRRRRFLSSASGQKFLDKNYPDPTVQNKIKFQENFSFDDVSLMALMARARSLGVDGYIVEQSKELFFSNRREDILLFKP